MARPRRTNPAMLAIVGEGFMSRLSFGMVAFALPLYARELGMSLTAIGVLASLNMMVALVLKPLMGILADRIGLRLGLSLSIVARSVVTALLAVAAAPLHLFAARALHGVSIAMRDPSVNALIAEHGGKKAIAQSFAWYQTAKSVAGSLSKVAAGVLITITAGDFSTVFLAAFALSLVPILVVVRYVREPDRSAPSQPAPEPTAGGTAGAEPAESTPDPVGSRPPTLRYAGAGFLIGSSTHMLNTFFPILATEYAGLSAAQAGGLYTIGAVAALTGPAFGWLSDNVSRTLVLQLRSAANVISSVLYWVSPNLVGFAGGRLLDDLGKAAFKPAWGSMMAHVSSYDRRRRAQIMGTISSGEDAGELAGPLLAGVLWSTGGVPLLLGARIAVSASAELYMAALAHGGFDGRASAVGVPGAAQASPRRRLAVGRRGGLVAVPSMMVAAGGLWMTGVFDPSPDSPDARSPARSAADGDAASPGALADARRQDASRRATAPRRGARRAGERRPAATSTSTATARLRARPAPRSLVQPAPAPRPPRGRPERTPSQPKPGRRKPPTTPILTPGLTPPADVPHGQPPASETSLPGVTPEPTATNPAPPPQPTPAPTQPETSPPDPPPEDDQGPDRQRMTTSGPDSATGS